MLRLRLAAAIFYLPVIAGCSALRDAEEVRACEVFIKEGLRSPATYERVEVTTGNDEMLSQDKFTEAYIGNDPSEIGKLLRDQVKDKQLAIRRVFIRYDAANAYGTPIRDLKMCEFLVADGALQGKGALESQARAAASNARLRSLTEGVDDPGLRSLIGRGGNSLTDCCVR